ncbi:MAG: hypothetical protein SFX19_07075 [Alphaproteobacteria bacterium]|nr:hypothetical protein [Alphaproteobacteria bacterium]
MAKIYETTQDLEREQLDKQAAHLRAQANKQTHRSLMLLTTSLIIDIWNRGKGAGSFILSALSTALTVGSIMDAFKAWKTDGRARELEAERSKMGPEVVLLPPQSDSKPEMHQGDCDCHTKSPENRLHEALKGRSLFEYAQKPVDPGANLMH